MGTDTSPPALPLAVLDDRARSLTFGVLPSAVSLQVTTPPIDSDRRRLDALETTWGREPAHTSTRRPGQCHQWRSRSPVIDKPRISRDQSDWREGLCLFEAAHAVDLVADHGLGASVLASAGRSPCAIAA